MKRISKNTLAGVLKYAKMKFWDFGKRWGIRLPFSQYATTYDLYGSKPVFIM